MPCPRHESTKISKAVAVGVSRRRCHRVSDLQAGRLLRAASLLVAPNVCALLSGIVDDPQRACESDFDGILNVPPRLVQEESPAFNGSQGRRCVAGCRRL